MALLKYFKRIDAKKHEKIEALLPKVDGHLATLMPMSSIEAANVAVRAKMIESIRVTELDEEDKDNGSLLLQLK